MQLSVGWSVVVVAQVLLFDYIALAGIAWSRATPFTSPKAAVASLLLLILVRLIAI